MAAEFVAAAAANTVGNLATEYASPYFSYFFRFAKIVEDFKNWRNELVLRKVRVENDVAEAKKQAKVIEKDVEEWLKRAEKELREAQSLEEEIERKKCFNWCPSWGWRYCLSITVAKKTRFISQLLAETCNFQRVGQRPPLQGIEFLLPKDFMASESSTLAFNGIMKALNSDGVNMIGLYGMPGVGKTTLAEVILKQATEQKLFDKVVSVTVSQTPNFKAIRERIAELFGLNFEASTEKGKAEELWRRLKGENKILIILDDVWKELELQTIGIPFGGEHEGCKILLTTRLQQVCSQMDCHKEFKLNILSEDEAWALFKDKAGLKDDSPTFNVAKEVARECDRLPLAIVTVAKALKGRNLNGWLVANQRLKDSRPLDNQDVCIYSRLELSYDYLEDDNVKSCFLLCSLFPEDFEIPIEILVICGIGQGLFSNINSYEVLRREIYEALTKLQQSGLLLETDYGETIKMHDVVRDFAHWITSRGENIFMVKDELTEWPTSESFGCYTAISSWGIKINNFPDKLEFSKLKIFFLKGNISLEISSTLFEGMKTLQVLLLRNVVFSLEALKSLTNLRTLCFQYCRLENISSLRNMGNLEILALFDTNIHELPEELVELCRLKSVYFYGEEHCCYFPPNVLSRLASLQEVHVASENNVNLLELNSLSRLSALTLRVSTDQCSQENFVFPKLQRYKIEVNEHIRYLTRMHMRTLRIRDFSSSLNAFKELFCNVEILSLSRVTTEFLIDTKREQSPTTAFSNLVNLYIYYMTSLKELCHGQSPISFLQKLETLCILDCEQLQSVFQMNGKDSQTRPILHLRSLELQSLPALESIWKEPTYHVSLQSLKEITIHGCDKLKSIFSPCLAQSLSHLEHVQIYRCKKLEQVFAFDKEMAELKEAPLSSLRRLELRVLPALESIWKEPTHHVSLKSLKDVKVDDCDKLKSIFSPCLTQSLLHLQQLKIFHCQKLEQVFAFDQEMAELEENQVQPLSNLTCLELKSLPKLSCIWRGSTHFLNLQSLKTMRIESCSKVDVGLHGVKEFLYNAKDLTLDSVMYQKNLIPNVDPKGLNELTFLALKDGKELECLIDATEGHVSNDALFNLVELVIEDMTGLKMLCNGSIPKGFLQNLEKLAARNCMEIVSLSPTPQSLKFVEISYCNRLKHLFSSSLAQSLVLLEELMIDHCDGLQHIITELGRDDEIEPNAFSPFLPKLETLRISHCPRLEYVFQIPLAQVLPPLKSFWITDSPQLQQVFIVAKENNGVDGAIALPCLQDFQLVNLINLSSENFLISSPSLEKLVVCNCPKLTTFTILKEVNQQIQLKELSLFKLVNSFQLCISANCNQEYIAVGSHEEELKVHGLISELHLEDLSELRIIWKAVAPVVTLENLTILKVIDCERLQCLFPLGSACCLPKLEVLWVIGNSKLEQVFEVEDEVEVKARKEIKFDQLQKLSLVGLPSLVDFCPRGYHFILSDLRCLNVEGCPKMTTGFFIDAKKYVHAKTETPQLVEPDATEGLVTAENVVHTKAIEWFRYWGSSCKLPPYKEEL